MKKILLLVLTMTLFTLVACQNEKQVSPIDDSQKVEMSVIEKLSLLSELEMIDMDTHAIEVTTKVDLLVEEKRKVESEDLKFSNKLQVVVDTTSYFGLGANANQTISLVNLNKLSVSVEQLNPFGGNTLSLDLSKSFFLLRNGFAYANLNGEYEVTEKDLYNDNKQSETFKDKKIRSEQKMFTDLEYQSISSVLNQLNQISDMEVGQIDLDQLKAFDKMITVYKTNNVYTVRLVLDREFILNLARSFTGTNVLPAGLEESIGEFNFEILMQIKDNKLVGTLIEAKMNLVIDNEQSKTTIDLNEFKINFNFNPAYPTLPTSDELKLYEPTNLDGFPNGNPMP